MTLHPIAIWVHGVFLLQQHPHQSAIPSHDTRSRGKIFARRPLSKEFAPPYWCLRRSWGLGGETHKTFCNEKPPWQHEKNLYTWNMLKHVENTLKPKHLRHKSATDVRHETCTDIPWSYAATSAAQCTSPCIQSECQIQNWPNVDSACCCCWGRDVFSIMLHHEFWWRIWVGHSWPGAFVLSIP